MLLGQNQYSAAVDLWSTGCILSELACRRPLFPGDSEIDQIFRIFRLLGTPEEAAWPGVTSLPEFQPIFPRWKPRALSEALPYVPSAARSLLSQLIIYKPSDRLTAETALAHPIFDELRRCGLVQRDRAAAPPFRETPPFSSPTLQTRTELRTR